MHRDVKKRSAPLKTSDLGFGTQFENLCILNFRIARKRDKQTSNSEAPKKKATAIDMQFSQLHVKK
jgi:hypothetical protein